MDEFDDARMRGEGWGLAEMYGTAVFLVAVFVALARHWG